MRASYGQFLAIHQYNGKRVKQRHDIGWFRVNNDVRFEQDGTTVCDTDAPLFDEIDNQLHDMPPHYILFPDERPGGITIDGLTRLRDRALAVADRLIQRGVPVSDGIMFCDVGACLPPGAVTPGSAPPPLNAHRRSVPIGREDDIASVVTSTRDAPLVTIVGPGGMGKTTVALAVAERVEAGRIAAKDAIRMIGAGLRGAVYDLDDEAVAEV
jgi:hypothetical protein